MENNLSNLLNSAQSVLVLLPTRPTFDQVAAGLSFYLSLLGTKDAGIVSPAPMVVEFNRLIGVDKISAEAGNKNLTIKFKNYPAENIERVSADVENSQFVLTVIPKTGLASPKKDEVELGFAGTLVDLVILIGGENESDFPALAEGGLKEAKIVNISLKSSAVPASSVSEIAAILIKESGLALDPDIATNLVAGIEEGSNHFSGSGVSANTFEIMAHLLKAGGVRNKQEKPAKAYPPGSIPTAPVSALASVPAPKDWFEPKIYKGASVS